MSEQRARRLYRRLLHLYPRRFQSRFGEEMEKSFFEMLRLAGTGPWARFRFWAGALTDVLRRSAVEHLREARRRRRQSHLPKRKNRMETFFSDLRFAFRTLFRRPVFTITAVVTLALGIGANSTIFSIVNGLLLRPFPYRDSDQLVRIWSENSERGWTHMDISLSDAWEWRRRTSCFEDLAVYDRRSFNWTGGERPERVPAGAVSSNIFDVLGVEPALGRGFTPEDAKEGAAAVAVISDGFWKRSFGGKSDVLGQILILDGEAHTVVGVMPAGFGFPDTRPDLWTPFRTDLLTRHHGNHSNLAIARLAPGVSIGQAQREVAQAAAQLEEEFPDTNRGFSAGVVSLRTDLIGPIGYQASAVLMGAVGFVLLIACANVANLLLSRSSSRRHEIAVRSALGAGRARVMRQLLTESAVLALLGGALGVGLAYAWLPMIVGSFPSNLPPLFTFAVDLRVLAFTLAAALATALVFGLAPALRLSRAGGGELQEGGRSGRAGRSRLGGLLVAAEVALALVLMVGGTVMMRSVAHMWQRDLGFDPHNVLTMRITLPVAKYEEAEQIWAFFDQMLERVRALPGVRSAGVTRNLPLAGSNLTGSFQVVGEEDAAEQATEKRHSGRYATLSPGYLETIRARLLAGRLIDERDRRDSPPVVIVNQTLARRYFGDTDPLTRQLMVDSDEPVQVVGVIGDLYERSLMEPPRPSLYLSAPQLTSRSRSYALAVRTEGPRSDMAHLIQNEIWAIDPDQPVDEVRAMDEIVQMRVMPFQLIAGLMGVMAAISLLLSAVGIYGVTAYNVGRRRGEIGVRMALGARRHDILSLVLREGMFRSLAGLAAGLLLSLGLVQALEGLLVGVSATDPVTFLLVPVMLALVVLLGSYLPARRASTVDPVSALRYE